MGDTSEGPSIAAQSAQLDNDDDKPGVFARFRDAVFPPHTDEEDLESPRQSYSSAGSTLSMLNLSRMRVEDVAIPKTDIIAAPVTATKQELVEIFRECGLTRLPVFDGTLDTPIGTANLKDFALRYGFNGAGDDFDLRAMLRPLLFVPPSMPLGVLLQKMQAERIHMALVIDEYGGTDGLVTIEDLIEQVVGEIEDEHDIEEAKSWSLEKPGIYIVQARTELEDFEEEIGINLTAHEEIDEEEIDTLGGLVTLLAGHLPARGEVVTHPDGVEFEVLDADPRRIKRLRVCLSGSQRG
ncbi:transporter associated domain-containing protein [Yoonia sediminilitoris]|uniref:Magnesium and cobalt transporter n=1 Tax=Yoonia sediminilitoris TaxID=1286148 RepID=A0A2T6KJT9_9RHOB|nr:transporter associated domain-containing protein [Yoonia sediminilitoris]PUB16215.1 magnesium and cobalt transporter [Yoonia sediminilitoris]RCW96564.1 magnesium and cobalt transporter [Yoonia sediminilitoris]